MRSLFKATLLASTMAFMFNTTGVMAEDAVKNAHKPADAAATKAKVNTKKFKNTDDQTAYALGASLGKYMKNSLDEQAKLGAKLNEKLLMSGVQDAFSNKVQLSDQDIEKTLQDFETRMKAVVQTKMEQQAQENEAKGAEYRTKFAKNAGVKQTDSGLLYQVEKPGAGHTLKDSDTVVVNYKGSLIDGTEFDNSYKRGEPLSFRLDGVIPGWTEGLKHIKKGGKIKLVIPPELAYGKGGVPGIPANSTLVFDVELMDVKPAAKSDAKAAEKAGTTEGANAPKVEEKAKTE